MIKAIDTYISVSLGGDTIRISVKKVLGQTFWLLNKDCINSHGKLPELASFQVREIKIDDEGVRCFGARICDSGAYKDVARIEDLFDTKEEALSVLQSTLTDYVSRLRETEVEV